ncbi:MAG: aminoglycoside phosphotransferase [Deltaproteobacteria bacterium]|nr:MAG: aminoglycoside phosphotransferase [Deltaproteobacteria bacterium]
MTETELRAAYAEAIGRPAERVIRLAGGAGNRIYWRLVERDGRSAVVMELPPESGKSEEVSKEPSPKDLPFLDVHRYLERIGVRVPRVFLDAHRRGFVVIEDLTDQTLEMALQSNDRTRIYQNAIDQLAKLRVHAESNPDQGCVAFSRAFDYDLYQWEFEHFIEYGLLGRGAKPSEAELTTLRTHFNAISKELAAAPRSFTHRDYQSRNIMVLPTGEQVVIDFQDALQGPRQYDLVALLRDSYVELDRPLIDKMLKRYLARLVEEGGPKLDEREFVAFFDLLTVQRKLKDAGRFVFIDQVKKNPSFLVHIPSSLKYVKDALARRSDLAEVRDILARHVPELR